MVIGQYSAGKDGYAALQAAGAVTTIAILFLLARTTLPLRVLGGVGYSMIAIGAFISAFSPNLLGYVLGFLLVVGFDKMFNVYMRSIRQRVIPPQDFGKTVGMITLLNNMSQPLAGLVVALSASTLGTQKVVLILAVVASLLGSFAVWRFAKASGHLPPAILKADQESGK